MHDIKKPNPPYLRFEQSEINALKTRFITEHNIEPQQRLIFVHPGHGGSANNMAVDQYAMLINQLTNPLLHFVITAGPGEKDNAQAVIDKLEISNLTLFESKDGLVSFAKHIAFADSFISGSTGPLHIAGVLNRKTAAFYPRKRSANPVRWQTPNEDDHRMAFRPPERAEETAVSTIDVNAAAQEIARQLL